MEETIDESLILSLSKKAKSLTPHPAFDNIKSLFLEESDTLKNPEQSDSNKNPEQTNSSENPSSPLGYSAQPVTSGW